MLKWITDFIKLVEKHPKNYNENVKNNTRQIKELITRKDIFYKEADPNAFVEFSKLIKHREGEWAGQPLILNREQRYIIACVLGIKQYSKKYKQYLRYFSELDLFVCRKWGKDHFIAPLMLWFTGLDKEPSAWCQIVAENKKQAQRTFDIAAKAIRPHPLNKHFKLLKTTKNIVCKANDGKIEFGSGRTIGKDGDNPSCGVVNEAHEITRKNQYDSIKSGFGARKQPMMIVISSPGKTPMSLYETLYERNRAILKKEKLAKNDRIFALMFGIDDFDEITDTKCWIKGNPSMYEDRPTLEFLKQQYVSMKDDPAQLATFTSKHLGRNVGSAGDYFSIVDINKNKIDIKKEYYINTYAFGGVDLAETVDLANATVLIPVNAECTEFIFLQKYFIARERLEQNSARDQVIYSNFTNVPSLDEECSELLHVCEGGFVNKHDVANWFKGLKIKYNMDFIKIGCDRWHIEDFIKEMINGFYYFDDKGNELYYVFDKEKVIKDEDGIIERDAGILTDVVQGPKTLSPAIKEVKVMFKDELMHFDSYNELLVYCFCNLKISLDRNNNLTPHKAKSTGHIDGAAGLFDAYVAMQRGRDAYLSLVKNSNPYQGGLKQIEKAKKRN